jgi:hypothetical protein
LVDGVTLVSDIPPELVGVGERMVEGQITTAAQALGEIQSVV